MDNIEILNATGDYFLQKITSMKDEKFEDIESAPHAKMIVYLKMDYDVDVYSIITRKI